MPWKWWNIPRWLCQLKIVKYTIDIHRLQCLNHPNWVHVFVASPLRAVAERPWPFRDRPLGFVWSQIFTRKILTNIRYIKKYGSKQKQKKPLPTCLNKDLTKSADLPRFVGGLFPHLSPPEIPGAKVRWDPSTADVWLGWILAPRCFMGLSHCMVLVGWLPPPPQSLTAVRPWKVTEPQSEAG